MVSLFIIIGIIGGILGGMGMGGGTLLIPLLTLGLGVEQQTAQLVNLLSFIPMSLLALIVHIKNGYVVCDRLPLIIIPATLCSVLGSYLATVLSADILRKAFGIFLTVLGGLYLIKMVFDNFKKRKS